MIPPLFIAHTGSGHLLEYSSLTHAFSALGPETEEQIKLAKDKILLSLICSFEKVMWMLAFRSGERFGSSFYFKIIGIVE